MVKFTPLTAGRVAGNLASAIVPVNCPAGILVKFVAAPLNDAAVTTPTVSTPPEFAVTIPAAVISVAVEFKEDAVTMPVTVKP